MSLWGDSDPSYVRIKFSLYLYSDLEFKHGENAWHQARYLFGVEITEMEAWQMCLFYFLFN